MNECYKVFFIWISVELQFRKRKNGQARRTFNLDWDFVRKIKSTIIHKITFQFPIPPKSIETYYPCVKKIKNFSANSTTDAAQLVGPSWMPVRLDYNIRVTAVSLIYSTWAWPIHQSFQNLFRDVFFLQELRNLWF